MGVVVAALAATAIGARAADAARFAQARRVTGEISHADVKLDRRGDVYLLILDVHGYRVLRVGHGQRHGSSLRVRVPGRRPISKAAWDVNAAGAVAVAARFGYAHDTPSSPARLMLVTARPGGQFAKARVIDAPARSVFGQVAISPVGKVVEWWRGHSNGGLGVASADLGGRLRRRAPPRGFRGDGDYARLGFDRRDRPVWSWTTADIVRGDQRIDRLWTATATPDFSQPGRGKLTARWVYPAKQSRVSDDRSLLDGRGGETYVGLQTPDRVYVMRRREGHAFGPARTLNAPVAFIPRVAGAANAAGDAVFAWDSDPTFDHRGNVLAMVVGRNGHMVGPQVLATNGHYVGRPQVGIDARGRALVGGATAAITRSG